jgi:hypothetical protein
MGPETAIMALTTLAGVLGGFQGGKRMAKSEALTEARELIDTLKDKIDVLEEENGDKGSKIDDLASRVKTLESLVTQRADVAALTAAVRDVEGVVERIAETVGA